MKTDENSTDTPNTFSTEKKEIKFKTLTKNPKKVKIVAKAKSLKPLTTIPTNYEDDTFEASKLAILCDEMVTGSDHHEFRLLFIHHQGKFIPIHKIGQTNILEIIEKQITLKKEYDQGIYKIMHKDVYNANRSNKKAKTFMNSVKKSYIEYYNEFNHISTIKEDIIEFYNNVHLLLLVVYMIENNLENNPRLTFSECIKNTNLSYKTRLKLHDLNRLRNVLIHNNISFKMLLSNWIVLQTSFQELTKIVQNIVEDNKTEILTFRDKWYDTRFDDVKIYETDRMTQNEKKFFSMVNDIIDL
jgi:hypothetical protein